MSIYITHSIFTESGESKRLNKKERETQEGRWKKRKRKKKEIKDGRKKNAIFLYMIIRECVHIRTQAQARVCMCLNVEFKIILY